MKESETIKKIININDYANEKKLKFKQIIENLSEQHQRYLTLKFEYGYSFREIAKIEKTPKSTIQYRIEQAIKILQNQLPNKL